MAEFIRADIEWAIRRIHPTKPQGLDRKPAFFYQKYWSVVGNRVSKAYPHVFNNGVSIEEWNNTVIVLIPKVKKPTRITQFRPISLYNVVYKIIIKTIANRLKAVQDDIIAPNKSALVPERLITNNVVVGIECIHSIRNKRKWKKGYITSKLNMSKACEYVIRLNGIFWRQS